MPSATGKVIASVSSVFIIEDSSWIGAIIVSSFTVVITVSLCDTTADVVESFSVLIIFVTVVLTVELLEGISPIPLIDSELALRLIDISFPFDWLRRLSPSSSSESDNSRSSTIRRSVCTCEIR